MASDGTIGIGIDPTESTQGGAQVIRTLADIRAAASAVSDQMASLGAATLGTGSANDALLNAVRTLSAQMGILQASVTGSNVTLQAMNLAAVAGVANWDAFAASLTRANGATQALKASQVEATASVQKATETAEQQTSRLQAMVASSVAEFTAGERQKQDAIAKTSAVQNAIALHGFGGSTGGGGYDAGLVAELEQGAEAFENFAAAGSASIPVVENVVASHGRLRGSTFQIAEGFRIVSDVVTGQWNRALRSGLVETNSMLASFGLLQMIFDPLVIGIAAVAATVGAAILSFERMRGEANAIQISLMTVAQASGLTVSAVFQMASAIAEAGNVSEDAGRKIAGGLLTVEDLSTTLIPQIGAFGEAWGKIIGKDAIKGAEDLGKAIADPAKGMDALNAKLHDIDPAFRQHIVDLQNSGKLWQAQLELLGRVTPALSAVRSEVESQQGSWAKFGTSVSNAYDWLGRVAGPGLLDGFGKIGNAGAKTFTDIASGINTAYEAYMRWVGRPFSNLVSGPAKEQFGPDIQMFLDAQAGAAGLVNVETVASKAADTFDTTTAKIHSTQSAIDLLTTAIEIEQNSLAPNVDLLTRWATALDVAKQKLLDLENPAQAYVDTLKAANTITDGTFGANRTIADAVLAQTKGLKNQTIVDGQFTQTLSQGDKTKIGDQVTEDELGKLRDLNTANADRVKLQAQINASQGQGAAATAVANERLQTYTEILKVSNDAAHLYATGGLAAVQKAFPDIALAAKGFTENLHTDDFSKFVGVAGEAATKLREQADIQTKVAAALPQDQTAVRAYWTEYYSLVDRGVSSIQAAALAEKDRQNVTDETILKGKQYQDLEAQSIKATQDEAAAMLQSKAAVDALTAARKAHLDVLNDTIAASQEPAQVQIEEAKNVADLTLSLSKKVEQIKLENEALQRKLDIANHVSAADKQAKTDADNLAEATRLLADAQRSYDDAVANNPAGVSGASNALNQAHATVDALNDASAAHARLNQQVIDATQNQSQFTKEIERGAKQVDSTLTSAIANALSGQRVVNWGQTFRTTLAQIAAELLNIALIKPAIGSVLAGVGLNQAANAISPGSGGGSGASLSGPSGVPSVKLFGSGTDSSSIFSGDGLLSKSSLDQFGLNFGIGTSVGGAGTIGGASAGSLIQAGGVPFNDISGAGGSLVGGQTALDAAGYGIDEAGNAVNVAAADISSSSSGIVSGLGSVASKAAEALPYIGAAYAAFNLVSNPSLKTGVQAAAAAAAFIPVYGWIAAAVLEVVSFLLPGPHPQHPTGQASATLDAKGNIVGAPGTFTTDHGNASGQVDALNSFLPGFAHGVSAQYGLDLTGEQVNILNNAGTQSFGYSAPGTDFSKSARQYEFDPKNAQSVADAMTKITLEMIKGATSVENADLAVARFNIDVTDTAANIQKAIDFALNFKATVKSLTEGGGFDITKSIFGNALTQSETLFASIHDFLEQTKKLFPDGAQVQQANDAVKAYVETLIGMKTPVEAAMSPVQIAVTTLKDNIATLQPVFDLVGISAEEAAASLAKGLADLTKAETLNLQNQDFAALGYSFMSQFSSALGTRKTNLADSGKDGANISSTLADKVFSDQVASIISGAAGGANGAANLQFIRDFYKTIDGGTEIVKQATAALKTLSDSLVKDITGRLNSSAGNDFLNSLTGAISQLATDTANIKSTVTDPNVAAGLNNRSSQIFGNTIISTLSALDPTQIKTVIDSFANDVTPQGKLIERAAVTISGAIAGTGQSFSALTQASSQATQAFTSASLGVSNFLAGMDSSTLSPLDPQAQLNAAHDQFMNDLTASKGGDANAAQNVLGDAQNYLKLAQGYDGAATSAYATAYADVKNLLQTFVAANPVVQAVGTVTNAVNAGTNATTSGLNSVIQALKDMVNATGTHGTGPTGTHGGGVLTGDNISTANGPVSKSAADAYLAANRDVLNAATLHTLGVPMDWTNEQVAAWHFANYGQAEGRTWSGGALPTLSGAAGAGGDVGVISTDNGAITQSAADKYLAANPDVAAAFAAGQVPTPGMTADQFAAWHDANFGQSEGRAWDGGNVPHLARGGMVTGGTPGVDSVRAMLMPQERVLSVADNSELVDQIREMNERLGTVVDVLVAHSEMTQEQLVTLNASSSDKSSTNKRQAQAVGG